MTILNTSRNACTLAFKIKIKIVIQQKYLIGFINTSVADKLLQGMWDKSLFEQTVHKSFRRENIPDDSVKING